MASRSMGRLPKAALKLGLLSCLRMCGNGNGKCGCSLAGMHACMSYVDIKASIFLMSMLRLEASRTSMSRFANSAWLNAAAAAGTYDLMIIMTLAQHGHVSMRMSNSTPRGAHCCCTLQDVAHGTA